MSSSGDWSGNVFDFAMKILPKLQSDLKIPFVVKGFQRIDDTPLHRLLREAVTNCLVHADYYGRQGIVVSKNKDGFVFANPGGMRISKREALSGGVSDPRNATLLKMFSFIRFGERAGSGLNGIVYVWKKVYHTDPEIFVKEEYDRTFLTLPTLGNEPDVKAMEEFYPDEEETNENDPINVRVNDPINENDPINNSANDPTNENDPINISVKCQLLAVVKENPYGTYNDYAMLLDKSESTIKRMLQQMRIEGTITRVGAKKNGHWEVIR